MIDKKLVFDNVDISDTWMGYFLNNCLPLDHPLRNDVFENPRNVNWDEHLLAGVRHEPIVYKFLRIGKKYWLRRDIDSLPNDEGELPLLPKPILINVKWYDYGEFTAGLPAQKISVVASRYRATEEGEVILKPYMRLPNSLTTKSKINRVATGRRSDAIDFVEARAIEIDTLMPGKFDLKDKIADFFRNNISEMALYEKTGATDIKSKIEGILNQTSEHWLKNPIPVDRDENQKPIFKVTGEEIIRIFDEAIEPITQAEIDLEIAKI